MLGDIELVDCGGVGVGDIELVGCCGGVGGGDIELVGCCGGVSGGDGMELCKIGDVKGEV